MAALKPASSSQMQKPADAYRAKGRPKSQGRRTPWILRKSPETLAEDCHCLWMFAETAIGGGIPLQQHDTRPAMRNDLVQQGRDGDHRALGLEPEAAQGLQMLGRPHRSLRHCRAAEQ